MIPNGFGLLSGIVITHFWWVRVKRIPFWPYGPPGQNGFGPRGHRHTSIGPMGPWHITVLALWAPGT